MRTYITFLLFLLFVSCASHRSIVTISPNERQEIEGPESEASLARIQNKTPEVLEIKVVDASGRQLRGFGLGKRSSNKILVEKGSTLILQNSTNQPIQAKVSFTETQIEIRPPNQDAISFVLRNNTAKSIPLLIPSVMNPNLSPFSNSGVDLEIGQEILFKENGKRYVLLVVDDSIQSGEKIDVAKLLKARKKELGL